MKIAYLLASFPNTSETFILNEIAEAIRQGINVRVFSLLQPPGSCPHATARTLMNKVSYFPSLTSVSVLRLLHLHFFFLFRYPYHYVSAFLFALRHRENATLWTFKVSVVYAYYISKFEPNLLHTHFAYDSCRLTMLISKLLGLPYTLTIHGWSDLYGRPPADLRLIMLETKKTITVCQYNRRHILDKYKIPEDKITVIRCGIPAEFFLETSSRKRETGLIISVGRLHYHKAFHVLIAACKLLVDRDIPFLCLIVGDGELRKDLQEQIESLHLTSKVRLIGARSHEEVREIFLRAEVFAMSSAVETVGLAIVEALASEVPVVATRIYGVPEMVRDNETGLLCETANPECIANHLEKLLSNVSLGRSMGNKGRSLVMQEHNLAVQVAKLIAVWAS